MENNLELPVSPPWRDRKHRLSEYRFLLAETQEDRLRLAGLASRLAAVDPRERTEDERNTAWLAAYTARVADNLARVSLLAAELQAFINAIDDSTLRRLFTLRYIEGYTWKRIAFLLRYQDESSVRKLHDRYLRRLAEGDRRAHRPKKTHVRH